MEHIPVKYNVLTIGRNQNQYNRSLKYAITYRVDAFMQSDDGKLIPAEERQIHIKFFKTLNDAKDAKEFYDTHYSNGWGQSEWVRINKEECNICQ